eukprot:CAMPEP_0206458414 /NCGR_PEP_ID=MMETSP0324_2-20121206/23554_1 /ASSEMBLY_ACC=CAM_ASM_000836 /TAXON_ID=2866 /ORGANISM="Crypthecodinium cohnii, Strain Seligo" /LENGTH=219 /DNA_ID=CAMNT_0053929745 /DNA_START=254 /DNA_END=913 /DNA_ORIENTATION=+
MRSRMKKQPGVFDGLTSINDNSSEQRLNRWGGGGCSVMWLALAVVCLSCSCSLQGIQQINHFSRDVGVKELALVGASGALASRVVHAARAAVGEGEAQVSALGGWPLLCREGKEFCGNEVADDVLGFENEGTLIRLSAGPLSRHPKDRDDVVGVALVKHQGVVVAMDCDIKGSNLADLGSGPLRNQFFAFLFIKVGLTCLLGKLLPAIAVSLLRHNDTC